jgi:hypothetical protein
MKRWMEKDILGNPINICKKGHEHILDLTKYLAEEQEIINRSWIN